jgi:biopolymer transport protein ExbD
MLSSSGFLIRFIDIGLILLLGFMWISDISSFTHIEMPNETQSQQSTQQAEPAFLRVSVKKQGAFEVERLDPETDVCAPTGRQALEDCLRGARGDIQAQDRRPIVLIKPMKASATQHTVDVMDVCDRLGIAKSIRKSHLQL